ncbi:MAG: TonB-dependent receptor [Pseudomonadota bacterium]
MKKRLLASASCAVASFVAASAVTGTAHAQSAVEALTDNIVVTATKKSAAENVQDVPIAITALGRDQLDAVNVQTLQDLSFVSPNVQFDDIGTTRGTANFSIRGLGINSSIPSIDPAVGVFVDGVYYGVNSGLVFDIFDIDSVEILRGPQGILFGRNTTGGAVVLNTGDPTDEFEVSFRAATETPVDSGRGGLNSILQGTVSGPIIEGKLNGKISAYYNYDDGYFVNQFNGERQGEAQTHIIRGALEWLPTEAIRNVTKFEYFRSVNDGPSGQNRGLFDRESFDISINSSGEIDSEAYTISNKTEIDVAFGDGTITNIFGYRSYTSDALGLDIDSTPVTLFHSDSAVDQSQFSDELRYAGSFGDLDVTAGLYYFTQSLEYDEIRNLFAGAPGIVNFSGGGTQDHNVFGVFLNLDYSVTDKLKFNVGGRYSRESKDAEISFIVPRGFECRITDGTCPFDATEEDAVFDGFLPRAGVQYFFTDTFQAYFTYSEGFRSGGFNLRVTNPGLFTEQVGERGTVAFNQEELTNYEIGTKIQSEDGRFQLNVAGFRTVVDNLQRDVNVSSPTAGVSQFTLNTGIVEIFGLEVETRYQVADNLLLLASYGRIDDGYDEIFFDLTGDGVINDADFDLSLPRAPENVYGVGFIHELDMGNLGGLTSQFNLQHRDAFAYTDDNLGFINAIDDLTFNITWATPIDGLEASFYGKNMLDQVTAGGDTQLPFGAGPFSDGNNIPFTAPAAGTFSPLNRGRRVGFELTYRN